MNSESCVSVNYKPFCPSRLTLLKNPFFISIDETFNTNNGLEEGIRFNITSEENFWIVHYWGVNITQLHKCLELNWNSMRLSILEESFLEDHFLQRSKPEMITVPLESSSIKIKPLDKIKPEDLGPSPRSVYPLVVILFINTDEEDVNEAKLNPEKDSVACLITIIHIYDSVCKMSTNIISQFTKQKTGQVIALQTLYTPEVSLDQDLNKTTLCVICLDNNISRALLPCRHACICGKCYAQIDRCPICRSYISSFFYICNESQPQPEAKMDNSKPVSPSLGRKVITMFSRIFK